ncbi:MAG: undecaprenyl-diphosphatase UppP [Microbacteriaceae bacterium]|nr:undecaprenyl-diphosphatase UppP [Microbacteriaceae bacterium]
MSFFEALILGLVQGLTEFLPVSSSAHVQIAQELLDLSDLSRPELTAFIAIIQLGTELAVVLYFANDILRIIKAWFSTGFQSFSSQPVDARLGWLVIIGTIPIVALGLIFENQIENELRSLTLIGITLIVFGIALGLADWLGPKTKEISKIGIRDGVLIGLGQAMALIPGVSRSGGSITVGRLLGLNREAATRFSFLIAIPAVLGAGLYQFITSYTDLPEELLVSTLIATVVSFVVGYAVIAFLLAYVKKGSFLPFVIWRVLVGVFVLTLI